MVSIAALGMKVLERIKPDFTDRERKQIVDILTTTDPERVRAVLNDESGMAKFVELIKTIVDQGAAGARRAGSQQAGTDPQSAVDRGMGLIR